MRKWALSLKVPSAQHLLLTLIDPAGKTGRLIDGQKRIAARMGRRTVEVLRGGWRGSSRLNPRGSSGESVFSRTEIRRPTKLFCCARVSSRGAHGHAPKWPMVKLTTRQKRRRPRARNDATMRARMATDPNLLTELITRLIARTRARNRTSFFKTQNPESDTESDGVPGSHATEVGDRRPRPCLAHGKCAGLPKRRYAHDLAIKIAKHLTMPPAPERTNRPRRAVRDQPIDEKRHRRTKSAARTFPSSRERAPRRWRRWTGRREAPADVRGPLRSARLRLRGKGQAARAPR